MGPAKRGAYGSVRRKGRAIGEENIEVAIVMV